MNKSGTCEHDSCDCRIDAKTAVQSDGHAYCSERCAEGRGCDHADCNCGEFPKSEPKPDTATPHAR